MNRTNNANSKNLPKSGNILDGFKALNDIIPHNDGTRSFIQLASDAYDISLPLSGETSETTIKLTHKDHMISQINDSFLQVTQNITIQIPQLTTYLPVTQDDTTIPYFFFGYKGSNQIFRQLKVLHEGRENTGYMSQECIREGFAYSNLKPITEKRGKRGIHSTYEAVSVMGTDVCGVYVPLTSFKNGSNSATIQIKSLIPISDLLPFQAFSIYPSKLCGELAAKVQFSTAGLVWCMVPPQAVLDITNFMNNSALTLDTTYAAVKGYDRFFHQIGDSGNIIDYVDALLTSDLARITPIVTGFTVTQFRCQHMGFGVSGETYNAIQDYLRSNPVLLPAQQLQYFSYTAPDASGLNASIQIPFENVETLSLMFPTTTNQRTVFTNPCVRNLQMNIDDKLFPPTAVSTITEIDPEFLVYQLNASDLDGCIEPTKSFIQSIVMPRHNSSGVRFANTSFDNTDFMCNFALERSQGGSVFDGFNTTTAVNVKLQFNPVYSGANDVYYLPDSTNTSLHPPGVQVWLCRDTFWVLGLGEVHYMNKGTPR